MYSAVGAHVKFRRHVAAVTDGSLGEDLPLLSPQPNLTNRQARTSLLGPCAAIQPLACPQLGGFRGPFELSGNGGDQIIDPDRLADVAAHARTTTGFDLIRLHIGSQCQYRRL